MYILEYTLKTFNSHFRKHFAIWWNYVKFYPQIYICRMDIHNLSYRHL